MELAIQLYGYLILTFLAIVTPIFILLLSIFGEGFSKLTTQYENERSVNEKNIDGQVKQLAEAAKADRTKNRIGVEKQVKEIRISLKTLKKMNRNAKAKLSYLNPRTQVLWLFILLAISFLGAIFAILNTDKIETVILLIVISLIFFGIAVVRLWKLFGVIIEVRKNIDKDKKDREMKTIELLSALTEKETQEFLKDICVTIDDKKIEDDTGGTTMRINTKKSLKIGINNNDYKMAKNIEIGFVFKPDFIIEKQSYYSSIYVDKLKTIPRYYVALIQGRTYLQLDPLIVTPIKEGKHKIEVFIKGENIKPTRHYFNINVQKVTLEDIEKELFASQEAGHEKEKE